LRGEKQTAKGGQKDRKTTAKKPKQQNAKGAQKRTERNHKTTTQNKTGLLCKRGKRKRDAKIKSSRSVGEAKKGHKK
jgi:hypothetical protein